MGGVVQKLKSYRSEAYIAWVKTLPCCHCRQPADDAHHIKGLKYGTVKPPDFATMPLCREHHEMVHAAVWVWQEQQTRWLIETLDRAFSEGVFE